VIIVRCLLWIYVMYLYYLVAIFCFLTLQYGVYRKRKFPNRCGIGAIVLKALVIRFRIETRIKLRFVMRPKVSLSNNEYLRNNKTK